MLVALFTGFLLSGCNQNLADDPEDLSVGIAEAAYERDTETLVRHPAPTLRDAMLMEPEDGFEDATLTRLTNENLPEGNLQTSGVQQLSVPLVPDVVSFYDVTATDPEDRAVTVTVAVVGTEDDDDYEYCAVAVRPQGADPYNDDLFEFVLGGEDTCGL
ncbi:MAG: hypothetical protein ACFB50_16435 [Rubrobacteraceae bacterium]